MLPGANANIASLGCMCILGRAIVITAETRTSGGIFSRFAFISTDASPPLIHSCTRTKFLSFLGTRRMSFCFCVSQNKKGNTQKMLGTTERKLRFTARPPDQPITSIALPVSRPLEKPVVLQRRLPPPTSAHMMNPKPAKPRYLKISIRSKNRAARAFLRRLQILTV